MPCLEGSPCGSFAPCAAAPLWRHRPRGPQRLGSLGSAFYRVRRRRTAEAHLHASATASPRCGCPWSPSARGAAGGSVCTPTRTGRRRPRQRGRRMFRCSGVPSESITPYMCVLARVGPLGGTNVCISIFVNNGTSHIVPSRAASKPWAPTVCSDSDAFRWASSGVERSGMCGTRQTGMARSPGLTRSLRDHQYVLSSVPCVGAEGVRTEESRESARSSASRQPN